MGNIIHYIETNGKKTMEELPYNEVDGLIFSVLSYIDFDGILDDELETRITLESAANQFFTKYTQKEIDNNILGMPDAIHMFKKMKNSVRYQHLLLYNYVYKCDDFKQFSALFIDLDASTTFISFEGTDDLVSGWKEDAALSYQFPVPAQREAIKYINRSIPVFSKRKYILGGHSKGGNLALVAAMYANPLIKRKIKKVINHDGPGLRKKQIESRQYKKILPLYEMIIPNYSVIGLLLRHRDDYKVVKSTKKGIMAHNFIYWEVRDNQLVEAKLSSFSKKTDKIITDWLNTYNDEMREKFVREVFAIFKRARIESLLEIKASTLPNILNIIRESKN